MKTAPTTKSPLKTRLVDCQPCNGKGLTLAWCDMAQADTWGRCPTCGGKGFRHLGNDGQYYAGIVA